MREQILQGLGSDFKSSDLFLLLLNTSQFEFRLRTMYKNLLNDRQENFDKYQSEARSRMVKLAAIYEKADGSGRKTHKLKEWFLARDEQMSHLSLSGKP